MKTLNFFVLVLTVLLIEGVVSENYRPIYDLEEWRQTHPALASLIPVGSVKEFGGRIVGGQEVVPNTVPFQACVFALFSSGRGLCGGSVLTPTVVLTAAHCVDRTLSFEIVLGAHNISNPNEVGQVRVRSSNRTFHAQYNPSQISNDIAVVRLPSPVTFTTRIQAVALPPRTLHSNPMAGLIGTVTGWGRFSDSSSQTSQVLRRTSNEIISNIECARTFPNHVLDSNICITGAGGRSACNGDSGGPLVVDFNNRLMQAGIVSFGSSAGCERGFPAVFVRITSFAPWIESQSGYVFPSN